MKYINEYLEEVIYGNELTAIWTMILVAALWGCALGVTGVLAMQANRRKAKGQS